MRSLSNQLSSLVSFLVELVIYSGFVAGYFLLVLHLLGSRIDQVFRTNRVHYALLALALIAGQGFVMERLTTAVMWVIQRVQTVIPALFMLWRPQESIIRPRNAPGLVVYRFAGPLMAFNAAYFARRVREVINEADSPPTLFLINAEAIIDMDRAAVETLDELHNNLKKRNIELGLCEVKGDFRKMLMRTPLPRRVGFNVYPSVAAAIGKLSQKPPLAKR